MRDARLVAWALLGCALIACERGATGDAGSGTSMTRVVSLHDVTTEMVVALGLQAQLVGLEEPVDLDRETAQNVAALPRVSGLESILASRPHLVLGLAVVAERDPELVARLREAGIEVHLADPATLEDVVALTHWVANRLGVAQRADAVLAALRELPAEPRPAGTQPARVFVYDCCDPPFTAGGKTVLSDLIARAGGRNVFAQLDTDWTNVSWEEVVARRPELIVVHAYRYEGQGDAESKRAALRAIPGLERVPTLVMPLGCSLGGLRSGEGMQRLRAALQGRS